MLFLAGPCTLIPGWSCSRVAGCEVRVSGCGLRGSRYVYRGVSCEIRVAGYELCMILRCDPDFTLSRNIASFKTAEKALLHGRGVFEFGIGNAEFGIRKI